jgi:cell division protein FtsI (penicillin-binding protein 3)
LGVAGRGVYLQVLHGDFLRAQGQDRYLRTVVVPAHRGALLDRNGEPLAVSTPVDSAWADPVVLRASPQRVPEIAAALGVTPENLEHRLTASPDRRFIFLRRHLNQASARALEALDIPGVGLRREYRRYYPTGEVTAQLLGYTDIDDVGLEGLELAYEGWLRGRPGSKRVLKDLYGRTVKDLASVSIPQPGGELELSIDRRVQYLAYRSLKAAVLRNQAAAGMVVVLDPRNGEILALVNQPSGNPNDGEARRAELQRNRSVTDLFEPGSTLKPFTVAAALDTEQVTPTTPVDTSPGRLKVRRQTVRDVRDYGMLDVAGVLRKSSNVGVSKLALQLPEGRLWRLYDDLGFGRETGVELPGEQSGTLEPGAAWDEFELATRAFGYGLSVTAIQLAQAYAVLAADGLRVAPTVLRRTSEIAGERVLSAASARAVRHMLQAVVSDEGTAPRARIPGYKVAGKTGTVRKLAKAGGYDDDRFLSLFAGIVPASAPRLVVVVVVDDPRGEEYYGGQVAAPVFAAVAEGAMRLLNVPPDDLDDHRLALRLAARGEVR